MLGLSRKTLTLTALFAAINIVGLVWIHHDLTQAPKATVRILSTALVPDADNPDRIRLAFDRDMVAEAALGRVEKAAYFQLAPACPGRWTWAARDTLEYLLDKPLPEGCLVKVSATPQLRAVTGRTLEGTGRGGFETRPYFTWRPGLCGWYPRISWPQTTAILRSKSRSTSQSIRGSSCVMRRSATSRPRLRSMRLCA